MNKEEAAAYNLLLKRYSTLEIIEQYQPKLKKSYILQLLGTCTQNFEYRRFKLNKYMNENLEIPVVPYFRNYPCSQDFSKIKYVIASHPGGFDEIKKYLPKDCKVFYDKTDFWNNRLKTSNDVNLIKRADLITCSSQFIYNHLPKEKTLLIENGSDLKVMPKNTEKHERLSAIYVGFPLDKLDVLKIKQLAKQNPDMDFYIYCQNYDKTNKIYIEEYDLDKLGNIFFHEPMSYEEILEEISKCHVGLLLLRDNSDWTQGMFSLKVWDYLKCGIPIYYSNSINYQKYDDIFCFDDKKYNIKEVAQIKLDKKYTKEILEKERWENKFDTILKYYGII